MLTADPVYHVLCAWQVNICILGGMKHNMQNRKIVLMKPSPAAGCHGALSVIGTKVAVIYITLIHFGISDQHVDDVTTMVLCWLVHQLHI